ncbi:mismatch-specific DNA-glycosylase [Bacillus taeanensis]|uniref:Mismatch-specific DNA-glycosylase n=1 Tax=Bacillus taeanensis TaxID=273032 RepID=A0A366XXD3_9BACI|nr:mismatch-specific DNA-glycosylase [Bacillus taeanensis]RBW69439.1 mismatch-specific DNA-glycosylase [Bacillus taeanensis]
METIPDYLKKDLLVLFVGFNPSIRSSEVGHHFANPTNRFWKILYHAGLTPEKMTYEEDFRLLKHNYGLTNIVSRPTKAAVDITKEEYQQGRENLRKLLLHFQPKCVCFVGKGVYQEFSGKRKADWGFQEQSVVAGVREFVAPSSSGLVRMKLDEITAIYRKLTEFVELYR